MQVFTALAPWPYYSTEFSFTHALFADDIIVALRANRKCLRSFNSILEYFTGINVNLSKSAVYFYKWSRLSFKRMVCSNLSMGVALSLSSTWAPLSLTIASRFRIRPSLLRRSGGSCLVGKRIPLAKPGGWSSFSRSFRLCFCRVGRPRPLFLSLIGSVVIFSGSPGLRKG